MPKPRRRPLVRKALEWALCVILGAMVAWVVLLMLRFHGPFAAAALALFGAYVLYAISPLTPTIHGPRR
jgi:hypothetical protein